MNELRGEVMAFGRTPRGRAVGPQLSLGWVDGAASEESPQEHGRRLAWIRRYVDAGTPEMALELGWNGEPFEAREEHISSEATRTRETAVPAADDGAVDAPLGMSGLSEEWKEISETVLSDLAIIAAADDRAANDDEPLPAVWCEPQCPNTCEPTAPTAPAMHLYAGGEAMAVDVVHPPTAAEAEAFGAPLHPTTLEASAIDRDAALLEEYLAIIAASMAEHPTDGDEMTQTAVVANC